MYGTNEKVSFLPWRSRKIAPNLLARDFHAERPNQKWVTDVTEFSLFGSKLYLSPVLDLYNGEIISYAISERANYRQVMRCWIKHSPRLPDSSGLILHSDQGWQYQNVRYQKRLLEKGIRQSMSRKGNCLDNAVMENFFGLLKSELLYLRTFQSLDEFCQELIAYLEYYNHNRIKEKLNGLSPVQYRIQMALPHNFCPTFGEHFISMSYTTLAQSTADWALSKVGCAYSQAQRTQEDIFDCSSLVARAYSAQGKRWKYGGSVPTSNKEIYDDDFELLWPATYAQIGKSFGGASIINMAKQPGDLQFLCTDSGTSRANKITHVTMVASPTQIVHARGTKYGCVPIPSPSMPARYAALSATTRPARWRLGMKGYRTLRLQQALNAHGADISEDGEFGEKTQKALKVFQADHAVKRPARQTLPRSRPRP